MSASFSRVGALAALAMSFAALGACASRGAPVQAPVELAIAPIGSTGGKGSSSTGPLVGSDGRCSVRLVGGRIEKSSPGCYLDEHISESPGVLYYPCGGDGPAEADFGAHRYSGRVDGGEVDVELETELDWEDGCRWGTKAVIKGKLVSNGGQVSISKKLSWLYRDHVITGAACSGVCVAKSSFQVTSTRGRGLAGHGDDDGDGEEEEEEDEDSD